MAHELAEANGKTSMAYFGDTPWHGLGTQLDNPATAAEAIVAAGLDYNVDLTPLVTHDGRPVSQRKGTVRSDNGAVLGVVGNTYAPIQNVAAFEFLDSVVADADSVITPPAPWDVVNESGCSQNCRVTSE